MEFNPSNNSSLKIAMRLNPSIGADLDLSRPPLYARTENLSAEIIKVACVSTS